MKLAVKNDCIVADIAGLKAISETGLPDQKHVYVESENACYTYLPLAKQGTYAPNDQSNGTGFWHRSARAKVHYIVDDAYDFVGNDAIDKSTVENFHRIGCDLVGSAVGFKDWKALRDTQKALIESKMQADYSDYETALTNDEKECAKHYIPTKISDKRGYDFLVTECGGEAIAEEKVLGYINEASKAREKRFDKVVGFAYKHLGKTDGLKSEKNANKDGAVRRFIKRGVLKKDDDGVDGFADWIYSLQTYATDPDIKGLDRMIADGDVTIKTPGLLKQQFLDTINDIAEKGIY